MATVTVIPIREAASSSYREPTLAEILSDPIVGAVMRADAVDPGELRAMLARTARALRVAAQTNSSFPQAANRLARSSPA